jgi:hypothetical protein
MTRLILALALFATASLGGQEAPRHDQYREDAKAYCWNPKSSGSQAAKREKDPHGHRCACHLYCQIGSDNKVIGDQEDSNCELYCTRDRCNCHVEEPCEKPG